MVMMIFFKKYKLEIVLLAIALAAHFFFFFLLFFYYGPDSFYNTNVDAAEFFQLGKNLYEHHVFSSQAEPPFYLNSFRTILYPLYLVFFRFFTASAWLPILFQNIIGVFSVIVAYRLGYLVTQSKRISFLAALILAIDPLSNYWANIVEPDTVLVFFILISILYFLKFYQTRKYYYLYFLALFLGLAALIKPVAMYYTVFFSAFILIGDFLKNQWKKAIKPILIFFFLFFIVISPWFFRNWHQFKIVGFTSLTGVSFYRFAGEVGPYPEEITDYLQKIKEKYGVDGQNADGLRDIRAQKELQRLSLKRIFEHPMIYSRAHLLGMVQFYLNDGHEEAYYNKHYQAMLIYNTPRPERDFSISQEIKSCNWKILFTVLKNLNRYMVIFLISKIIYLAGYLIMIYGLIRAYKLNKKIFGVFLLFFLLSFYIALAAGPWGIVARYRLPVWPGLLLIFSFGLFQLVDLAGNRRSLAEKN